MADTVTVSSSAGLMAALKVATAGETIRLAAGSYAGVVINGVNSNGPVTIESASAAAPATLDGLTINASSNLSFKNLDLSSSGSSDAYYAFRVASSSNISFSHLQVSGDASTAPGSQLSGFDISNSNGVTIADSSFSYLNAAITANSDTGVNISGNTFSELSKGGVEMGASSNVIIADNYFTDFDVACGVHSDAIQLYTAGTTVDPTNINISNNTVYRGSGDAMQGIFVQDETGTLYYDNLTINNNDVVGGYWNSIYVHSAVVGHLSVQDNMVESYSGTDMSAMTSTAAVVTTKFLAGIDVIGDESKASVVETGNTAQSYIGSNGASEAAPTGNASIGVVAALTQTLNLSTPVSTQAQSASVAEHGSIQGDLVSGDSGNGLYASAVGTTIATETAVGSSGTTYKGAYGQLTVQSDGSYTYTETKDGLVAGQTYLDSFSATIASDSGGAAPESITIDVTGSSTGNGLSDTIYCGAGPETVSGFGGGSRLYSGTGNDTFQFDSVSQSTPANQTVINGFKPGDMIDLSELDPAFHIVSKFDGEANELVVSKIGAGNWEVYGDTTGSGKADFQIHLTNVVGSLQLAASDFDLSSGGGASSRSNAASSSLTLATNLVQASAAFSAGDAASAAGSLVLPDANVALANSLRLAAPTAVGTLSHS